MVSWPRLRRGVLEARYSGPRVALWTLQTGLPEPSELALLPTVSFPDLRGEGGCI